MNNLVKSVFSEHNLCLGGLVNWVIGSRKDSGTKDSVSGCNQII